MKYHPIMETWRPSERAMALTQTEAQRVRNKRAAATTRTCGCCRKQYRRRRHATTSWDSRTYCSWLCEHEATEEAAS